MTDKAELLLKATAVHCLLNAVANMNASLNCAVEFERTRHESIRKQKAQYAAYHQFEALIWDEAARSCGIESDEMHRFMHLFFATDGIIKE
jgi:hypothetical protein